MKIGIDISQIVYEGTGVGAYVRNLISALLKIDKKNEYILFFSSMRRDFPVFEFQLPLENANVRVKTFKFPPTLLDFLWNKLHILPIEWLIGHVDVFISSDWTQPPTLTAKKVTILYDLIVYEYPQETAEKIVETQKRRLHWVAKECDVIFCISEATKLDAKKLFAIDESRLEVLYPGVST